MTGPLVNPFAKPKNRPQVKVHLDSEILLPIAQDEWPTGGESVSREKAWLSKHFMVQQFAPVRGWVRLTVNRPEVGEHGSWKAEITWAELMLCKRECGYADRDAIEILPHDRDVVDVSSMRHIWLLPDPEAVPCIWRTKPEKRTPFRKPTAEEQAERMKLIAELEKLKGQESGPVPKPPTQATPPQE